MIDMPAANPNAYGMHLTDCEFAGILLWLKQQSKIVSRVWVWGSRQTGSRPSKVAFALADIDVAVELAPHIAPDERPMAMFQVRWSFSEFATERPEFGLAIAQADGVPNYVQSD